MAVSAPIPSNPKFKDLTGQRFGRFSVESYAGHTDGKARSARWNCRCDCGVAKTVLAKHLKTGRSSSCGCLNREQQRLNFEKHGQAPFSKRARHPLYSTWCSMKKRCLNPKADNYPHYGGRGVTVCTRWRDDFTAFLADVGARPAGTTLDRIDPEGHYEPGNVRWATRIEHRHNRRSSPPINCGDRG